jgi:hypothetical protein
MTKLAMLKYYEIDDTIHIPEVNANVTALQDFILMHKRVTELKLVEVGSKTMPYEIGDTLPIPKSANLVYLYADFQYSLFGKIRRLLYQPNRMAAEIFYDGIDQPSYNLAVVPILKGGVLINKKAQTFDDAFSFFESQGRKNTDVRSIRFTPKSLGFKDKGMITLKEFKIE